MGTTIRAELSKNNPYWIEKHRYYELKHFCLQYPIWKEAYNSLGGLYSRSFSLTGNTRHSVTNPTERIALARSYYLERMNMVNQAAEEADPEIAEYVVIGVTQGISYDILRVNYNIPCCKDVYYETYRHFFWLLNKIRD
nr:hypothetical protein [uncultured Mediterraneibacter sp.]